MSLHLTPEMLEQNYEMLRVTPPFSEWTLPGVDEVAFNVLATRKFMGQFRGGMNGGHHEIGISNSRVGTLDTLTRVMAHEMIHLRQEVAGTTTPNTEHNADFRRLAKLVADRHCFDPKEL